MRALFLLFWILLAPAWGHPLDEATLEVDLQDKTAQGTLRLPGDGFRFADENGDGVLQRQELRAQQKELRLALKTYLSIRGDGLPGAWKLALRDGPPSESHVELGFEIRWAKAPTDFVVSFQKFDWESPDQPVCLASFVGGGVAESAIFDETHPRFEFSRHQKKSSVGSFFRLGLEHIITGYDHLLFLLTLLLAGGSLWVVTKMVTAFTLAHSLTLGLAVLGYLSLPGALVEPIIALSITWAAAENYRNPEPENRWILAGLFGLIHGLGFAGVLAELNLTGTSALNPLLGFNLGVEAGQMLGVVLVFPMLVAFRGHKHWRKIQLAGSAICGAMGLYWFLTRLFG